MYNINPLMRNVLITFEEVLFHAPTKHTLDPRMVESSIIIAEERFIRPELEGMYNAICEEKNLELTEANIEEYAAKFPGRTLKVGEIVNAYEFLTPAYLKLWKQHLWKLTAECVALIASPEAWIQLGTQGLLHTIAPASPMGGASEVSPDLRSVKWIMDTKQKRIDPLIKGMHTYLCSGAMSYPLYTRECCNEKKGKKTDIILGLYDKQESCRCDVKTKTDWTYYYRLG